MMTNMQMLYARTGATALAAVLALSSTQLLAQETPTTAEPAPVTEPAPAPAPDTTPIVTTPDPLAPASATIVSPKPKAIAKHAVPVKSAAATPPRTVAHAPAKQPAIATAAATPVAVAPALVPPAAAPKPAVQPAPSTVQAAADNRDTEMEIGGGALALLVLGGGAVIALKRRRRRREEEQEELAWADEPQSLSSEPVAEPQHDPIFDNRPVVYAPSASAFGWNTTPPATQPSGDESDRLPGETWVERAYRGPTAANPSVSLKARLKRAAFFDKREREVEAGTAVAVEPGAGLPDNLDESVTGSEREREVA